MVYVMNSEGVYLFSSEEAEGFANYTEIEPPFASHSPKFYDFVFNAFTQKWSARYNFERQQKHLAIQKKREDKEREMEIERDKEVEAIIMELEKERREMLTYSNQQEVEGGIIPLKKTRKKSV